MSQRHQRGSRIARLMLGMIGPAMASVRWPDGSGQPYGHDDRPAGPVTSRAWRELQEELVQEESRRQAERERVRREAAARRAARQANGTEPRPERLATGTVSFDGRADSSSHLHVPFALQSGTSVNKRSMRVRPARRHHRRQVMPARLG